MIETALSTFKNYQKIQINVLSPTPADNGSLKIIFRHTRSQLLALLRHTISWHSSTLTMTHRTLFLEQPYRVSRLVYQQVSEIVAFLKGDGHDKI